MAREDYEAVAQAHQRLAELNGYDAPARAGRLLLVEERIDGRLVLNQPAGQSATPRLDALLNDQN